MRAICLVIFFFFYSLGVSAQNSDRLPTGFIMPNLSVAPACVVADKGKMYYNTTGNIMMYCDGTIWKPAASQWTSLVSPVGAINYSGGVGYVGINTSTPS